MRAGDHTGGGWSHPGLRTWCSKESQVTKDTSLWWDPSASYPPGIYNSFLHLSDEMLSTSLRVTLLLSSIVRNRADISVLLSFWDSGPRCILCQGQFSIWKSQTICWSFTESSPPSTNPFDIEKASQYINPVHQDLSYRKGISIPSVP